MNEKLIYLIQNQFYKCACDLPNLERLIARLIISVDHHLKVGVRGTISFAGESF